MKNKATSPSPKPKAGDAEAPPPLAAGNPAEGTPLWETIACGVLALVFAAVTWMVPRPTGDLYVAYAGARDVLDGKLGRPRGVAGPGTHVTPDTPAAPLVRVLGLFGIRTGGPDDWSFAEPRPVWMNQNWGTHLLFYASWKLFGIGGVPILKALLMLTLGTCVALACRQHRVRWPVCFLMAGCAIIAGHAYIDLRPNLTLLTFAPMMYWLLVRSRLDPKRIWLAVALMAFWANMHGSFIFGLGMMSLWAISQGLPAAVKEEPGLGQRLLWFWNLGFFGLAPVALLMGVIVLRVDLAERFGEPWYWILFLLPLGGLYLVRYAPQAIREGFRRWWPALLAPVIGTLLATVVTPFGLENLTHPLIMGRSESWRQVAEWRPVLTTEPVGYGSISEFFVAMALLAALAAARPMVRALLRPRGEGLTLRDLGLAVFSFVLCSAVVSSALPIMDSLGGKLRRLRYTTLPGQTNNQIPVVSDLYAAAWLPVVIFSVLGLAAVAAGILVLQAMYRGDSERRPLRGGPPPLPRKAPSGDPETPDPQAAVGRASLLVFDLILVAVVLQMGFTSRRFVTLSFGLLAPFLAEQLNWLFDLAHRVEVFRWVRPALLASAVVLIPAHHLYSRDAKWYYADNPYFPPHVRSLADRMVHNQAYPPGGADFLNANHVSGRAMEEWRWEGYLHWRCPQLKLHVGGRAQQAYDEPTYNLRMRIWAGDEPVKNLKMLQVQYIVASLDGSDASILNPLLRPRSPWVIVYYDRDNMILADGSYSDTRQLIDKITSGQAWYPNDLIPGVGATSRALCMSAFPERFPAGERLDALEEAERQMPSPVPNPLVLNAILGMYQAREVSRERLHAFFAQEYSRLENLHVNPHEDMIMLRTRFVLAGVLIDLASEKNSPFAAERDLWIRRINEVQGRMKETDLRWR